MKTGDPRDPSAADPRDGRALGPPRAAMRDDHDGDGIRTIDRFVEHVSTVPAIAGETVRLFLREKVSATIADGPPGSVAEGRVVLMVHGGFWPGTVAFDFGHRDYSFMTALARAGFDVFALDMTGYGYSDRPMMDDPRNLSPADRTVLARGSPAEPTQPTYPFVLVDSRSETADIDAAVECIRRLRGVEKVSLFGWSGGGIRTGTYALRHPEKVDRLVILASSNYRRDGSDVPPPTLPVPGFPLTIQSRAVGEHERWRPNIRCPGQVEDDVFDVLWQASLATDPVGAGWGPGVLRSPTRTYWGWTASRAARLAVPTLVMAGEHDRLVDSNAALYRDLGTAEKVFLMINCASHFVMWEQGRSIVWRTAREWFESATLEGARTGIFIADAEGGLEGGPSL